MNESRLAAIQVERRSLAAAIFVGDRLDYVQVRQLTSDHEQAEASAVGFANWIVAAFEVESAALEQFGPDSMTRRVQIRQAVLEALRQSGIPVWEIGKLELFDAFGVAPLKNRRELREVTSSLWPIFKNRRAEAAILDAVALGLYVQTDRRFFH
jgi:hypothetical protein